jgi:aminoglycoside phosphotransferase (APT) family kinase protein
VVADATMLERLLDAIREVTDNPRARWALPPERLLGGSFADTFRVRLSDAPRLEGDLVARILPEPDSWEREMLVQGHVAASGFPAPTVHLGALPGHGFDRAWILMDFVPGETLVTVTRWDPATIARVLLRLRQVPDLLARVTADIHRIEAGSIGGDLALYRAVGAGLPWFYSRATALGDRNLMERAERLLATRPPFVRSVLCHGDIHPVNILRDGKRDTVVDWTHAQYDDPHYDLAFTSLLLRMRPIPLPRFLRGRVRASGRRSAARFLAAYERESGTKVDPERLEWFTRLVALRIYIEGGEAIRRGAPADSEPIRGMVPGVFHTPYLREEGL